MWLQIQLIDHFVKQLRYYSVGDSLQSREESEVLLDSERHETRVKLRTVTEELAGRVEVRIDVDALDGNAAGGGLFFSHQGLESGRFSRSIHSKQRETFALL